MANKRPEEHQRPRTRLQAQMENNESNSNSSTAPNNANSINVTPVNKRKLFNHSHYTPPNKKRHTNNSTLGDIPEELDEGISFDSPSAGDGNCKAMERLSFTGSKNTHNTPMKLGSTDSRSMASKGYKKAELQSTRRREAEDMVDRYIKRDIRRLLDLAIPDDEDAKNAAGTLATSISILVEKLLSGGNRQLSYRSRSSSNNSRGSRGAATRRGGSGSRNTVAGKKSVSKPKNDSANITSDWITEQQNAQSTKGKPAKAPSRNSVAALSKSFDKFRQWVNSNNSTNESTLYEPISQFFCFVASYLKAVHTPSQSVCPRRLVVLFCKPNRKSADGDDSSRVDLYLNLLQFDDYTIGTLITNPPEEENEAPMLADTFAILFQYTRGIYNEQYDRRFAWGMAVGGKKVQAVFFGPDYALASDTICVDDASGRAKLVKLLVDWSFCEPHRLGYDPAILHNKRLRYYEIDVGGEDGPITYYSKGAVISAERLFGRHTRCFIASTAKPRHGATAEPDIFIKYTWPEATEDASVDYRDEGRHLQRITKTIEAEANLDGKCPRYQGGGRVMINRRVGNEGIKAVEDTSRSILSDGICQQLDDDQDFVNGLRVHKVICMKGVGKPLKELENVFEMICVMADAMECHWEIYQRCKILHRDISTNNILFSGRGSKIKGMLIDFDHAICEDDKDAVHHFERTGTLPFMSINNLEGGKLEHSLLDDWEFLIYILCWVGIYDWKKKDEPADRPCQFDDSIPDIENLMGLVHTLRRALIEKHEDIKLKGSLKWTLNSEEDDPNDVFVRLLLNAEVLDAELLNEEPNEEGLNAKPLKPLVNAKTMTHLKITIPQGKNKTVNGNPQLVTPMKKSTCDTRAVSNTGKSGADHEKERKEEAFALVDEYLRIDNDCVLTLAEPRLETTRELSANIVKFISGTIEELDSGITKTAKTTEAAIGALFNELLFIRLKPKRSGPRTRYASRSASASIPGMPDFVTKACQLHNSFRSWIPVNGSSMVDENERNTYECIHSLIEFVGHCTEFFQSSCGAASGFPEDYHHIHPCSKPDTNPIGADDGARIDVGLMAEPIDNRTQTVSGVNNGDVSYAKMFAIAEAKVSNSSSDVRDAFAQLFRYTRNIYACQINRRFVWGLTICGSNVRACHFSNDAVFASLPMDLLTSSGLKQYVKLLVDWSLCDSDQRGYDPDFYYDRERKGWFIRFPHDDEKQVKTYLLKRVIEASDRLFGRHTRCFEVEECLSNNTSGDSTSGPTAVLKDAWAYAEEDPKDDTRDEVEFLQLISKNLSENTDDIIYPELLHGGRVSFKCTSTGDTIEDTTASMLGNLFEGRDISGNYPTSFRARKRLVTGPVGEPLKMSRSFDELITVCADAMRCHNAVLQSCDILHRDISDNNILVVRMGDRVHGLLIDFDNAITLTEQRKTRPERTGTFPYMSINNLLNSTGPEAVPRTALDDWESLLYILCYYATIGLKSIGRRSDAEMKRLPIHRWNTGSASDVARAKKLDMSTEALFDDDITSHFYSKGQDDEASMRMVDFARKLYSALFYNPKCGRDCHGTTVYYKVVDGKKVRSNPFKERAKEENVKIIVNDLIAVLDEIQSKC
ncbi:hypothetical protein LPJ74_006276 [Coemansia sp. RSA 1843]|nr:hypothetical protein LPJ74_006276 [Coemansia sp. RSA 1843]